MARSLACVALALVAVPMCAYPDTDSGEFAVRGAGLIDCATYLAEQEKRSPAYLMMGGWIDGYVTGLNQYAPDTYDVTSFESTELFAEIVRNHCLGNPDHRLFAVLNSIVRQLWERRLTERSPLVTVELGEQRVQLYRETIERMQQQLNARGFLETPPSGTFDAATISAIAAFQKTIDGYEATGFPDQATLLKLFAGETAARD